MLEVNPCPDLSSNAGLARMGRAFGWSYDDLVMQIVDEALMRSQSHQPPPMPSSAGCPPRERHARRAGPAPPRRGRSPPHRGDHPCGQRVFRDDEVPVALEVFDGAVAGSPDYVALGATVDERLAGLDLLGTDALHPRAPSISTGWRWTPRRRPPGSAPLSCGKWKAGWPGLRGSSSWRRPGDPTTGQPAPSTRPAAIGRRRVIPDFYAPGDDQVVYVKALG